MNQVFTPELTDPNSPEYMAKCAEVKERVSISTGFAFNARSPKNKDKRIFYVTQRYK